MNVTAGKEGSLFTATACDKKWHNMEGRYKAIRDKKSKTGRAGGRQWLYYDAMEDVIGLSAAVRAVSEVSSGPSSKPPLQTKSAELSVIAPPSSDEEPENEQSSFGVSQKTIEPAAKKRRSDNMPAWFRDYSESQREEQKSFREEMMQRLQRQEQLMEQRNAVLERMANMMQSWVESSIKHVEQ